MAILPVSGSDAIHPTNDSQCAFLFRGMGVPTPSLTERGRLGVWIDPARVHPYRELFRRFLIHLTLAHHTAEGEFQMFGGAGETFVDVDVSFCRIDIVTPKQAGDSPPGPHTLGQAGVFRKFRRFGEFSYRTQARFE